ncbi:hypothetical protein VNI00_009191 [Paramarasmius palmivorus]|uniref:Uncharacterized protein n=1 Tax=Paramarasmius palmivorus TaxID=297713 RepID=A0AAW0CRR4_9AGAR
MLKHKSSSIHISQLGELSSSSSNTTSFFFLEDEEEDGLFTKPKAKPRERSESVVTIKSGRSGEKDGHRREKSQGKENQHKKKRSRDIEDDKRRTRQRCSSISAPDTTGPNSTVPFPSQAVQPTQAQPIPFVSKIPIPTKLKTTSKLPTAILMPTRAAPSIPVLTTGSHNRQLSQVVSHSRHVSSSSVSQSFKPFPANFTGTADKGEWSVCVEFYKRKPYFDVWDLDTDAVDEVYIGIPAYLRLKSLSSSAPTSTEPNLPPEIKHVSLACSSPSTGFAVSYQGHSLRDTFTPEKGIVVSKKLRSMLPSGDAARVRTSLKGMGYLPPDATPTLAPEDEHDSWERDQDGWFLPLLVPIPMSLIRVGNARAFRVITSVGVVSEVDGVPGLGVVRAETEMVISHLKSELEMKGRVSFG